MHSSRMRTGRLLTVSQQGTVEWGVSVRRGVYLPRGYLPRGVPASEMYLPRVCTCQGGTCLGGVPAGGVYLPRWGTCLRVYLPGDVPAFFACTGPAGCTCQGGSSLGGVPTRGCTCRGVPAQVNPHCGQTPVKT